MPSVDGFSRSLLDFLHSLRKFEKNKEDRVVPGLSHATNAHKRDESSAFLCPPLAVRLAARRRHTSSVSRIKKSVTVCRTRVTSARQCQVSTSGEVVVGEHARNLGDTRRILIFLLFLSFVSGGKVLESSRIIIHFGNSTRSTTPISALAFSCLSGKKSGHSIGEYSFQCLSKHKKYHI